MRLILILFVVCSISTLELSAKTTAYSFDLGLTTQIDSIPKKRKKAMPFRPSPIIGTSITYIPGDYFSKQVGWTILHEFVWSLNMAFPISSRWEVGLDYKSIMTFVDVEDRDINWMAGPFTHFNVYSSDIGKIFAETGLYMSNLCYCQPDYYTIENQFYLALGGGGKIFLSKNFSIDVAFTGYVGIAGELEKYLGTTLYIFGINYQF